ncbi:MAG: chemotaxis protein CheX [Desulfamplus sp.]|nr:chemotaxis protein CheX [Desulfamplus sp.]
MNISIKRLMDIVSSRTINFLADEMSIHVDRQDIKPISNNRLELNYITSVITVGSTPHIFIIFSYEKELMDKIFEVYTKELDIEVEERAEYIEETAGDLVNIIVGNSTAEFGNGVAISLSPPIVISSAESIAKSRAVKFFVNDLITSYGNLRIFCVGPNELFEI